MKTFAPTPTTGRGLDPLDESQLTGGLARCLNAFKGFASITMTFWVGTENGLFENAEEPVVGLESSSVSVLAGDEHSIWAIVDDHSIWRYDDDWHEFGQISDYEVHCLLPNESTLFAGTFAAHVYQLVGPEFTLVDGFEQVETRDLWGTPWGGPPSTRTMCRDRNDCIYANIHVGGLVRSTDEGRTWEQTPLDIDVDVHEVHHDAGGTGALMIAAARGFASSQNGAEWHFNNEGLHAHYLRAVTTTSQSTFVCASRGPRGQETAIYRRTTDGSTPFSRCEYEGGWLSKNIDAAALTTSGDEVIFGTDDGCVHRSEDDGLTWECCASELPAVKAVLIAH